MPFSLMRVFPLTGRTHQRPGPDELLRKPQGSARTCRALASHWWVIPSTVRGRLVPKHAFEAKLRKLMDHGKPWETMVRLRMF